MDLSLLTHVARGLALLLVLGMGSAHAEPADHPSSATDLRRALDPAHDVGFVLARADVLDVDQLAVRAAAWGAVWTLSYVPVEALQLSFNASPVSLLPTREPAPFSVSAKWAFVRTDQLVVSAVASMVGSVGGSRTLGPFRPGAGGGPALGAAFDAYLDSAGHFGIHATVLQVSPLVYVGSAGSRVGDALLVVATAGATVRLGDSVFLLADVPLVFAAAESDAQSFAEAAFIGGLRISGTRWALDLGVGVYDGVGIPLASLSWRG